MASAGQLGWGVDSATGCSARAKLAATGLALPIYDPLDET
jgi:hypothetical protein